MTESQREKPASKAGLFETTTETEMIAQQAMNAEITRRSEHWEVTRMALKSGKKNNVGFTAINILSEQHQTAQHRLTGAVLKMWKRAQP